MGLLAIIHSSANAGSRTVKFAFIPGRSSNLEERMGNGHTALPGCVIDPVDLSD